ncbi:hypothetical protein KIL84_016573 [Mauremys mutica]|uniref:Uncharacterized protein n=1 Tax=Mauremys mutica TaxID=74926 RepID=A0A9D3WZA5_9SAUR|nr:hypothetical protein KIL84_016573 [Mauremys mutica]
MRDTSPRPLVCSPLLPQMERSALERSERGLLPTGKGRDVVHYRDLLGGWKTAQYLQTVSLGQRDVNHR